MYLNPKGLGINPLLIRNQSKKWDPEVLSSSRRVRPNSKKNFLLSIPTSAVEKYNLIVKTLWRQQWQFPILILRNSESLTSAFPFLVPNGGHARRKVGKKFPLQSTSVDAPVAALAGWTWHYRRRWLPLRTTQETFQNKWMKEKKKKSWSYRISFPKY